MNGWRHAAIILLVDFGPIMHFSLPVIIGDHSLEPACLVLDVWLSRDFK
jgi:hypothetical protein